MINKNPLVSVIIPVYNVSSFICESVSSVIHQTYSNLEIILIDDGSTDKSGEICDEFAEEDSRVTVIHTKNKGLSAARNSGLRVMSGEVVAFLDPDDVFVPGTIETAVRNMLRQEADIVCFGYISLETDGPLAIENYRIHKGVSRIPPEGIYNEREGLRLLLQDNGVSLASWSMICLASVYEDVFFPEGYVYEDNYVTPVLFEKARNIHVLSDVLVINRRRKGSITRTHSEKNMKDQLRAVRFLLNFITDRTPDIFDCTAIIKAKEEELCLMIEQYIILTCSKSEHQYRKDLRPEILIKARELRNQPLRIKTRIKVIGIRYLPNLFPPVYNYFLNHQHNYHSVCL